MRFAHRTARTALHAVLAASLLGVTSLAFAHAFPKLRTPDAKHMSIAPGAYTVVWVAVAEDGHRTQGRYMFNVQ